MARPAAARPASYRACVLPKLFPQFRSQIVNLDSAYTDETALKMRLEHLLNAKVHRVTVRKVDLVNDTTVVDVCFKLSRGAARPDVSAEHPDFAGTVQGR